MFHPLITPLTTYMYTTDIQDNGTVSATDAERLPPGGFSLRHGFPEWFGRGRKSTAAKKAADLASATPRPQQPQSAPTSESRSAGSSATEPSYMRTKQKAISMYEVLRYVRSTFDTESALDSLPLDAAGNPNAWHAWRTHRKKLGKLPAEPAPSEQNGTTTTEKETAPTVADPKPPVAAPAQAQQQVRDPSEWNWDGVWELRVRKAIAASLSEPVLYGGAMSGAGDDVIRFSPMDEEDVESIKSNLRRTLEGST
ncbi:ubiquitin-conjugating enzyme [Sarocladium implicatum]|nr:ubiquitin-conjugating enzyme [Sarocladium implicatum]